MGCTQEEEATEQALAARDAEIERLRELNERFAKRDLAQIDRMFEMEKEIERLQAKRNMWHKIADERAAEIVRLHQDKAKLAKLDAILAEYRAGTRPFPMYGELAVLLRE
jgi:hypothetical protein